MHLRFNMSMKTNSTCEDMWAYYMLNFVQFLRVSATFCDHLQGGVLCHIYYRDIRPSVQIQNIKF
jgi:hypothetical protein